MNQAPATRLSLLERIRDPGDQAAWDEFVSIYQSLIYRLARRRGLHDADAREIRQDVLMTVAGAIDRRVRNSSIHRRNSSSRLVADR